MTAFVKDGWTGRVPPAFCLFCFTLLDAATNMEDKEPPRPGDCIICIECGSLFQFDENMQLLPATIEVIPIQFRAKFARLIFEIKERGPFPHKPVRRV